MNQVLHRRIAVTVLAAAAVLAAPLAVNVTLYGKRVKFDPYNDLLPVSWISSVPLVLIAHPSVPVKNVQELIALAKKTGKMNAGHNGSGTTSHLSIEMLQQFTGAKVAGIPYKGARAADRRW